MSGLDAFNNFFAQLRKQNYITCTGTHFSLWKHDQCIWQMETLINLRIAHPFESCKNLFKMQSLLRTYDIKRTFYTKLIKFTLCQRKVFGGIESVAI
jgi:hypothetical protein